MMIRKVEADGTVKDRNYMFIGKVKSDGTVVDRSYMQIGRAKDVPARWAAIFFFFGMFR